MIYRAINQTRNITLAEHVESAHSLWKRMKGLLGIKELPSGHGIWIHPCRSIHTFFMHFSIDALFISKSGHVVKIFENFPPFRVTPIILEAFGVLELPAGEIQKYMTKPGDHLVFEALL